MYGWGCWKRLDEESVDEEEGVCVRVSKMLGRGDGSCT